MSRTVILFLWWLISGVIFIRYLLIQSRLPSSVETFKWPSYVYRIFSNAVLQDFYFDARYACRYGMPTYLETDGANISVL